MRVDERVLRQSLIEHIRRPCNALTQRELHQQSVTELVEHLNAATPRLSDVHNVACVETTELKNSCCRPSQIGDVSDSASIAEELLPE